MRRVEIVAGERYGELEVLGEAVTSGRRRVSCRCDCGRRVVARLDNLRGGKTESCGGCGLEYGGERRTVSGWARWSGIKESTLRARLRVMGLGEALGSGSD